MQIPKGTADMLKRYFVNASPFLWGVLEAKRKKDRIKELKEMGFLTDHSESSKRTYDAINQDLLLELGIERIIGHIVVPLVSKRLGAEALSFFRRCWEQGKLPDKKYLKDNRLYRRHRVIFMEQFEENRPVSEKDPALIFLEINESLDFVDRWTMFAGLWFEIIEPLKEKGEMDRLETVL